MPTVEELDKRYREMFPEAAGAPTGELDTRYKDLFGPEKEAPSIITEEKPKELRWEKYEGPEIIDREPEPLWRKAAKWILPKKAEEFWGLTKPMPPKEERTIQERMQAQESARQVYYRDQKFQEELQKWVRADPKDFELPEGYKEPGAIGQLAEGIEAGFRGTLLPSVGYFTESLGRKIGSESMIKWGMETGDIMMVDFLSRPELARPEDLKPFLDGGWMDLRAYGRTIGETIPFMATVISLSVAGGLVGGPGGALAGGWASAAAIEQGNAYKRYIDEGVASDKAADAAFIYGVIAGGIENMMGFKPAGIANKILNPTRIATNSFKSYLLKELPKMGLSAMKKSIGEGVEEVAQQITEDLMAKWAGSEEGKATLKELGEQFIAGVVGSLPFGVTEFRAPTFFRDVGITKPITPADVKPVAPEITLEEKEKEAEIVREEEEGIKALRAIKTGETITIKKSYSGILEGKDSGFRTVEQSYAQGYADIKDGVVEGFENEVIENAFVVENHEAALTHIAEKYPEEVKTIRESYVKDLKKYQAETGNTDSPPIVSVPTDTFIREKLQEEGYKSLVYQGAMGQIMEYQIFDAVGKVKPKPEIPKELEGLQRVNPVLFRQAQKAATIEDFIKVVYKDRTEAPPEQGVANLTEFFNKVKGIKIKPEIKPEKEKIKTLVPVEIIKGELTWQTVAKSILDKWNLPGIEEIGRLDKSELLALQKRLKESPSMPLRDSGLKGLASILGGDLSKADKVDLFISKHINNKLNFIESKLEKVIEPEVKPKVKPEVKPVKKELSKEEKVKILKTIEEAEEKIVDIYDKVGNEKVDKAMGEIWMELDMAEKGERFRTPEGEWIGKTSAFPDWIPENLRSKELFDKITKGLDSDVLHYPEGNRSVQRELYNTMLEEIDSRLGIDTSEMRNSILENYEKLTKKEVAEPRREELERRERVKPEEEIKVKELFPEEKPKAPVKREVLFVAKKVKPQPINMVNLNKRTDLELQQGKAYYENQLKDKTYRPELVNEIIVNIQGQLDLINTEIKERAEVTKPKGVAGATVGKFRDGTEVEPGRMDKVNPIEFPELVELARDLSGAVPAITKRFRVSLGKFYAVERGRIKLDADLFKKKNEGQLAATLAHEIGHLVDYLPHQTLKRGNLLGSLLSLRSFLKNEYGAVEITNEEIREELKRVSEYWRPYDPKTASPSYARYRNSARELYADAVSVLFNTPGTLEKLAPIFYKGFFEALDAKPEFKKAYFDLQEVLSHDRETLVKLRRERTREMFDRADYKSEELQKVKEEEKQLRLKDYWNRFTYTIRSLNQPIYNKVREAEARGEHIPDDENPKFLLSARNYLAGQIKANFEESVVPIVKDLDEHRIDWKTFGEFLLYERITEGDRSEFANPAGITPKDADERIAALNTHYGKNFSALEVNATKFRKFLKSVGEEAYREGLFSTEMFDLIKGNEKYVPFQVVEYMEQYVSWKAKPQIGTLKDVNNPANSLILKAISTIKAIENQKNKMATFKLLEEHFADEIQESELQFTGRAQRPIESRDPKLGMVTYYKEGRLRGKNVDKYIAKSLEKDSIARNRAVMTVLSPISFLNQKLFRPLFVIYNPGWIPFNFIRDYMRFWKNTPGLSMLGALKRYGQAFRAARVRAFGPKEGRAADIKARELIRKLEKEKLLSVTWNDMLSGQTTEDAQIEAVMQKIGLAESKKEIPTIYKPFETIFRKTRLASLLQGIRKTGDLVETLPKVAGYYELQGKMKPSEMREFVRKNIGSPDFFEKGYLTPATNNIFLFSNAFIQAVTSDAWIATNPTTRSGFWWKTAKTIYLPKILMFAALMGAFGDEVKKMYSDASEYDMTNYLVIPIGRDSKNGKTIYLRIPMDETSRLLGGVLWKVMRGSSNDQKFGRDIADLASLFGGQLPSITPSISAPLSALDFAAGKNPYDSFRGRMVLTEAQMEAGGLYALKPFLLWQFQQIGGNVFVKFYAGEQTPREKSLGEKFLQIPILSNVVGRFVKISDYGQLEKYRKKLETIKGAKARERIDENKLVNEYVKKYQDEEGEFNELFNDLLLDVLGHAVSSKEEKRRADNIRKKFRISIKRGQADPKINALISAQTNEEKATLMRVYKEIMSEEDFNKLKTELLQFKIISGNVLKELNRPFQP